MRRALLGIAVALVVSACGVTPPQINYSPTFDSPALRAQKAAAHIQACPAATAPATGGLPNSTLPCLGGGRPVNLASLRGPMVVNLWGQYCGPCRQEMPQIAAFARKYAGRVAVLGVDYYDPEPSLAIAFAKAAGATYPLVADWNQVVRTNVLPTTILIDAQGRIAYKQPIAISSEAELAQLVAQHLGVKP